MKRLLGTGLCLAAVMAAPAHANGWTKAESQHFIVYSEHSDKETRRFVSELEAVHHLAESFYAPLSDTAIDVPEKPVYDYFATLGEFEIVDPSARNLFRNQKGCADGRISFWTDVDDIGSSEYNVFRFASLLDRAAANYDVRTLPDWLSLGLSSFLMDAHIDGDLVSVGSATDFQFTILGGGEKNKYSVLNKRDRISFEAIIADRQSPDDPKGAFRAQSWVVVHYLLDHPEYTSKLKNFVALYRSGVPSAEAWQQTIAIDPATLDQALDSYVRKGVNVYTYNVPALKNDEITLTPIANSGQAVPLLSAAAQTCPKDKDVGRILDRLGKAAKAAPGDAYTQRENLRARALIGDPAQALPALIAEVAAAPDDFDARLLLGRAYLRLAEAGGQDAATHFHNARTELGKGYTLNGSSSALLYYFARANADRPGYPDDNTLTAAEGAVDLNPGGYYRLYLAELYVRAGRTDSMVKQLKCIVDDNDKRPVDRIATQIIAAADAGRSKEELLALFATMGPAPFDEADMS